MIVVRFFFKVILDAKTFVFTNYWLKADKFWRIFLQQFFGDEQDVSGDHMTADETVPSASEIVVKATCQTRLHRLAK